MLRILAALLAALVAATPVSARMHAPYRGHRIVAASAAPPLDGMTAPSGAYSFRKLRSAYAGPAIRLRRASDNAELDINFLGCTSFTGCPWDSAAAASHCASTTCSVVTWYDQSGNARDLTQATQANQPALVFSCNGALPCLQFTLTAQAMSSGSVTPATGAMSFAAVYNRPTGTNFCTIFRQGGGTGDRWTTNNVTTGWIMNGTGGSVAATANNAVWHSGMAVYNGASSVMTVDGVDTTTPGSIVNAAAAGAMSVIGATGSTCNHEEAIAWDNYVLTTADKAVLGANQRSYYATP